MIVRSMWIVRYEGKQKRITPLMANELGAQRRNQDKFNLRRVTMDAAVLCDSARFFMLLRDRVERVNPPVVDGLSQPDRTTTSPGPLEVTLADRFLQTDSTRSYRVDVNGAYPTRTCWSPHVDVTGNGTISSAVSYASTRDTSRCTGQGCQLAFL